jgi:anti-anti-sigma regulatory factor
MIDTTGIKVLKDINRTLKSSHTQLLISGLNDKLMHKLKLLKVLQDEYLFTDINGALSFVRKNIKEPDLKA